MPFFFVAYTIFSSKFPSMSFCPVFSGISDSLVVRSATLFIEIIIQFLESGIGNERQMNETNGMERMNDFNNST